MYFLKRAYKYLINKKGRTILLGIIFLVIANFVLAGLLTQNASKKAEEQTRISIGSDLTYIIDFQKFLSDVERGVVDPTEFASLRATMVGGITNSESLTEGGAPTYTNFLKAIDSEYVKDYDMSISFGVSSENGYSNYTLDVGNEGSTNDFDIKLFARSEPLDFKDENAELIDGRFASIDEINSGANVVLVEESVMELNNLKLGDIFSVTTSIEDYEDIVIEYEIIGIYTTYEEFDQRLLRIGGGNSILPQNRLYVPFNTLYSIGMSEDELNDVLLISNKIYLNDPKDIDLYRSEVGEKIDLKYARIDANDNLYNTLVEPLESLGYNSKIMVLIISIAGALIIGLITALTINERKEEIGVLLAIGESKMKIISQFVVEVVIIAVIAFTLSTFTGSIIGSNISELMLKSEASQSENNRNFLGGQNPGRQIPSGENAGQNPGRQLVIGFLQNSSNNVNIQELREQNSSVDINLSIVALLQLFGMGILLAVVCTTVPSLYVMRFNPKQILTNRNS